MGKIFEFSNDIFPLRLWVVIEPTIEQLQKQFYELDDDCVTRKDINNESIKPYWGACRLSVVEKKTNEHGSLVAIMNSDSCSLRQIVHESCHAYDDLCYLLGLPECGETRAYTTEWIFSKVYDVCRDILNK